MGLVPCADGVDLCQEASFVEAVGLVLGAGVIGDAEVLEAEVDGGLCHLF